MEYKESRIEALEKEVSRLQEENNTLISQLRYLKRREVYSMLNNK